MNWSSTSAFSPISARAHAPSASSVRRIHTSVLATCWCRAPLRAPITGVVIGTSVCACACACVAFAFVAFAFVAQVCTEKKANAKLATFANTRARTTHRCLRVARTRPLASSCAEAHAPCGSTAARVRSRATVPGGSLPRPVPSPRPCARRTSPSRGQSPRHQLSGASPSSLPSCVEKANSA